jgi:hypothetical protein
MFNFTFSYINKRARIRVPFLHTGGANLASSDFVYTIYRLQ